MPTYGSWIQGADYPNNAAWLTPADSFGMTPGEWSDIGRYAASEISGAVDREEFIPLVLGNAESAFASANIAFRPYAAEDPVPTLYPVDMRWVYRAGSLGEPNWDSYAQADLYTELWQVTPAQAFNREVGEFEPFTYIPPGMPDSAIGYELEGDGIPVPLAVALSPETLLNAVSVDTSDEREAMVPVAFTSEILVFPSTGAGFNVVLPYNTEDGFGVTGRPLGTSADLTGSLGSEGTAMLWMRTMDPAEPLHVPEPSNEGRWYYGWWINQLILTWTLHPPRHRWIFPDDDTEPPRRIYPRDDGLTGGATRNYPPSKSVQAGNRTSGGYL